MSASKLHPKLVSSIPKLVIVILLITIIPYFILSLVANPSADDFNYWHEASLNPWNFQIEYYQNWSGRYFSTAIISLFPLVADPFHGYKLIPLFLLTSLFIALFFFFKSLTKNIIDISNASLLLGSLVVFNIYINNMPTTAEGFYWLSGAATYILGNILLIFLLSLLLWSDKILSSKNIWLKGLYLIFCLVIIAAIVGSSEALATQLVLLGFWGVLISTLTKHPTNKLWRIILVSVIIFYAISFLAPGNFVRQTEIDMEARRSLLVYILGATFSSGKYLNLWSSNLALLSASLLIFPQAILVANKFDFLNNIKNKKLLGIVYLISFLTMTFVAFFLTAFLKRTPPERLINISYLTFLLGWFIGIFIVANIINSSSRLRSYHLPKSLKLIVQIIFMIAIIFQINFVQSLNDLLRIPRYKTELEKRYDLIDNNILKGNFNVDLPAFTRPPETIFVSDITEDSSHYMNQWYAKFFGLKSVTQVE